MAINQIYALVNSVAKQALGSTAVTVVDTGSLVSLGSQVLASNTTVESFYSALLERIARTMSANRPYTAKRRAMRIASDEWGLALQKLRAKSGDAVSNPSYFDAVNGSQADPFGVTSSITVSQKLFAKRSTWSHEEVLPTMIQLQTAFTSAGAMGAFVSSIYTAIENRIQKEIESTDNLAVNTLIAGIAVKNRAPQFRNLFGEYIALGNTLDFAKRREDKGYNIFLARETEKLVRYMSDLSTLYNDEGAENHTPRDLMVVDILTDVAMAIKYNALSDTFNEDIVKMPNYNEINYWQGTGADGSFTSRSSIKIHNDEIDAVNNIELVNIIGCVRDIESCGVMFDRLRQNSIFNPRSDVQNVFWKADKGYYADMAENAVVLYEYDSSNSKATKPVTLTKVE